MAETRKADRLGRTMTRYAAQGGKNAVNLTRAREVLGYTYPIDRMAGDTRFSDRMLKDVASVLERYGFPALQGGRDMARLFTALDTFLYRRDVMRGEA